MQQNLDPVIADVLPQLGQNGEITSGQLKEVVETLSTVMSFTVWGPACCAKASTKVPECLTINIGSSIRQKELGHTTSPVNPTLLYSVQ